MAWRAISPNRRAIQLAKVQRVMTIADHLQELRRRLYVSVAAVLMVAIVLFLDWRLLMRVILLPVYAGGTFLRVHPGFPFVSWDWNLPLVGTASHQLLALSPLEPFFTVIDVVLAASLIVTSPLWLYQLWAFFAPVLDRSKRRIVRELAIMAIILFVLGAAFAYLVVLPAALQFLIQFGIGVFDVQFRASYYLGFVSTFLLAVGAVFDVPPALLTLMALGVVTSQRLRRWRKYAVFAAGAVSAFVVPSQDPISVGLVMLPIYLLYEISLWLAPRFERRVNRSEANG